VGIVYDRRELPGVMTSRTGVAGVLQFRNAFFDEFCLEHGID
jgi:hypothetical protein